uniref:Uncharacterized protein n=1 Tax=Anopheles farauti TaxID=69004 RepID=A0A182QHH0_9DIPT
MYSSGDGALFQAEPLPATRATYRREFEEMENRIRKCERQRAELERQFEGLMRERAECEKAAVRAMKQRQRRLMEAERQRAERNESILRMLNKIDQQAASLAAKTDRLKMLKTQYEMYLMRTWSQPYTAYNVPMIAAPPLPPPPTPPTKLLQTPNPVSTKSEFVQYLSDLTHQQTTNVNPIPPPTALSNYLASQQKPYGTTPPFVSYGGPPLERPYSRALTSSRSGLLEANDSVTNPASGSSETTGSGGSRATKFEMSNEDFIRYIDSEVLKEPIPTVSVVAATPTEPNEIKPLKNGAYLEDASEDEPVVELSSKLEECSMLIEAANVEKQQQNNIQPLDDRAIESGVDANGSVPEEIARETEERTLNQEVQMVTFEDNLGAVVTDEFTSDRSDQQINELHESPTVAEADTYCETNQHEPLVEERYQELSETAYPEQSDYNIATDVHSELPMSGDNQPQEMVHTTDNTSYLVTQPEEQSYDNQQYSATSYEVKAGDATLTAEQPFQQPSEIRNQHWNTARQALRAKAFPTASPKPPSPEMAVQNVHNVSETRYEPTAAEYVEEKLEQSPIQADSTEQNTEHATYGEDANKTYYETAGNVAEQPQSIDPAQATTAEEYHNDAMGQPVEYQESHYQPAQHDDRQQSAAYQYGDNQQATYQEGQYVEGAATGDTQYQYQAPSGEDYATQNAYQDPNQQYQYDENAQYYGDQQQGYDGQYYAQEQQQYYMDETQQQHQQQDQPTDQYAQQVDSTAYYPSEEQYEAELTQTQPDQQAATSEATADVAHTGDSGEPKDNTFHSTEPDAKPADPAPVIDNTLPPQDKQSIDKKTAKQDAGRASDAPPTGTVNDESDFDFSSQ